MFPTTTGIYGFHAEWLRQQQLALIFGTGGLAVEAAVVASGLLVAGTVTTASGGTTAVLAGEVRFEVDSGEPCGAGKAVGIVKRDLSTLRRIDVQGLVLDGPGGCREDGRVSTVTVKAFSGGGEIGRVSQQVDNTRTDFGAFLTSPGEAISRVIVHVCHHPVGADAPVDCGEPDILAPPLL